MVAISVGCNGTIQNLDRSLKLEIFQGTSQMLRLKPLVLDRRRTLYRVYTRELNRELCTRLSTLYTNT